MLTPMALVKKAREYGLKALAVTDHDCLEGLAEAKAEGARIGIDVISGVELSINVGEVEVHLLGYFFDAENPGLNAYLGEYKYLRLERGQAIVSRLNDLGLSLSFDDVLSTAGHGVIGRPHVARALVSAGLVSNYVEAFEHYLSDQGPAFVPKAVFPAEDALMLLHEAGGVGVLAHPGHWTADAVLMRLIRAGLDGIETIHPSHDEMITRYYRQVARDFLLIETGGSDYHGFREKDDANFGHFSIPFRQLDRARRRAEMLHEVV